MLIWYFPSQEWFGTRGHEDFVQIPGDQPVSISWRGGTIIPSFQKNGIDNSFHKTVFRFREQRIPNYKAMWWCSQSPTTEGKIIYCNACQLHQPCHYTSNISRRANIWSLYCIGYVNKQTDSHTLLLLGVVYPTVLCRNLWGSLEIQSYYWHISWVWQHSRWSMLLWQSKFAVLWLTIERGRWENQRDIIFNGHFQVSQYNCDCRLIHDIHVATTTTINNKTNKRKKGKIIIPDILSLNCQVHHWCSRAWRVSAA